MAGVGQPGWRALRLSFLFLLALLLAFGTVRADTAFVPGQPMRLPVDLTQLVIRAPDGTEKARFDLEIARTDREHARGLMHRTDMPASRAMLFVFPDDELRYFWMKDTPSSLDIIFVARDGTILNIARDTVPFSTDPIASSGPAGFVLEVLAGTSAQLSIVPGDRLDHPEVTGP